MKKITLLILCLFTALAIDAQVFPEGFETAVPPTDWASFRGTNGEGTAQDWTTSTTAASGSQSAYVQWENVDNEAEDWLVTPQFTPTAAANILTFQQRQSFTTDYGTTYTVRVSTASQTSHADFTIVDTQVETDFGLVFSAHNVDLSAYNDTPIYVAFVMTQDDGDSWRIDDVDLIANSSPPNCASNPTPADGAVDVVRNGDGTVTIAWDAPTTGDPATAYEVFWGETSGSLTSLGTLSATTVNITNANYSTTYYWMIVPENVGGSATGCAEWSFTMEGPPPPPANNDPSGAIAMTLDEGTSCGANSITGISNTSTTDSGVAAPSCGNYGGSTDHGDLWYTVVAPASGQITFNVENISGLTSVAGAFYSGTVGSLVEEDCTEFGSGWPWTVGSLTPGATYYLRVWDYGNDQNGSFDLCGYYQSCLDVTDIGASVTSQTEATISWTAGNTETAWNFEWGDVGFTQGSGTTGTASTNPTTDLTGLTDGNEYDIYVQADCGGGSTSGWVKFTWTQIQPPANDDCDNATALTTANDGTCTVNSGTTVGATASSQADDVTGTPNTDVWFTFVPYADTATVEITNVVNQGGGTSTSTDMGMAAYSGTCNGLTLVDDSDPNTMSLSGLTPGNTYYLRVYGWSSSIQYNTFDICVSGPLPPQTPSYTETFDSYPANGWTEAQGPYGSPSGTSSSWLGDDFANDTGHPNGRAARMNVFGTNADEYMISPVFDLSGGDAYLNFEIALTGYASTTAATFGPDDYVALLVTEDGGANWTELQRWDSTTTISNTGEAVPERVLSGYGSSVQFAFYAYSDTSNVDNDFFVDNFRVLADSILSTSDNELEGFSLFPTVIKDELKYTTVNDVQAISVYNLLGQEVLRKTSNFDGTPINVSSLKSGMYMVRVQVGNSIGTFKIVKE